MADDRYLRTCFWGTNLQPCQRSCFGRGGSTVAIMVCKTVCSEENAVLFGAKIRFGFLPCGKIE